MKAIAQAAQPAVFLFNDTHQVRVERDPDGTPWFCAKDICRVLGYANDTDAVKKHCRETGVAKRYLRSGGQRRALAFIDEGNLYRLILKSRLPAAQRFEAWVCDEVLPALRRTGIYVSPGAAGARARDAGGEALTPSDMANLRRAVSRVSCGNLFEAEWAKAIWVGLRRATGVPHPQPFLVDHLPLIEVELQAMCQTADTLRALTDRLNDLAIRLVKEGADPEAVLSAVRRETAKTRLVPDPLGLKKWADKEFRRLANREAPVMDHPEVAEV